MTRARSNLWMLVAVLVFAGVSAAKAQDMNTLDFDPTGRDVKRVAIAPGQVIVLSKRDANGDPHKQGTADIFDIHRLTTYTVPDGMEACRSEVIDANNPTNVALVFLQRSTPSIVEVMATAAPADSKNPACGSGT